MYTLLNELFGHDIPSTVRDSAVELDNQFIISIELSGVKKDDVSMEVKGNYLTIKATKKNPFHESTRVILNSRSFRTIEKSYALGDTIDKESISAELIDGVLTVTLQKKESRSNRKIDVR